MVEVDVAAAQDDPDVFGMVESWEFLAEHGCHGDSRAGFDQDFGPLPEGSHPVNDLGFGNRDDAMHLVLDVRPGEIAEAGEQSIGDCLGIGLRD